MDPGENRVNLPCFKEKWSVYVRNMRDGRTIYQGLEQQDKGGWLQIDKVKPEMPQKPSGVWATVVGHEHLHRAVPASNPALIRYLAILSGHFCLDSLENSSQKYKSCSWVREYGWRTNSSISQQNRPRDRLQPELLRGKVFPSVEILRGIPGKGEIGHKRKAGPAGQLHDTHRGLTSG